MSVHYENKYCTSLGFFFSFFLFNEKVKMYKMNLFPINQGP